MTAESAERAATIGYRVAHADLPRKIDMCEWTAGVHAFLTEMAKESGWLHAIGLRAAAGVVTQVRRKLGCIPGGP